MVNARDYYNRFNRLAGTGDIPVQDRDNREATYREAVAKLKSLQSNIAAAERQVLASELQIRRGGDPARAKSQGPGQCPCHGRAGRGRPVGAPGGGTYRDRAGKQGAAGGGETQTRPAEPELHAHPCTIPGIISRRTIQLGQTVEARNPFLDIVPLDLDNVWVVANFREEQMARVRVGQRAQIRVDGIPERTFAGWVESVAGGTGSVFSLFPPDNATGNFVRIVQRLPVRVRFAEPENYQNRIRPGMSARIVIDTTRFVRQSTRRW